MFPRTSEQIQRHIMELRKEGILRSKFSMDDAFDDSDAEENRGRGMLQKL